MSEPKCPQKAPYGMELEPKDYYWCTCGESKNQPFCDGTHKTTDFKPMPFKVEEKKQLWLCGCKKTKNPPYCDGTHKSI